jgi:hypothetical protein
MEDKKAAPSRYTVSVDKEHQAKLANFAKQGKVSQGDVIEILLDLCDVMTVTSAMEAVRERNKKSDGRGVAGAMAKKIAALSPEQRRVIDAMIAANEGKE